MCKFESFHQFYMLLVNFSDAQMSCVVRFKLSNPPYRSLALQAAKYFFLIMLAIIFPLIF